MAHFRFPLSVDVDNKRTSTHVSVNPYAISFQTNDATPVVYDGHEAKSIDLTALSVATAGKLTNARTIGISGAVTGTATNFDGTGNITIPTTAIDVSKANAGTLAIARGGTGKTSWTAFGIVYASAKNKLGQLGVGTAGQVLQSGGSAAPGWIDQADLVVGEAGKLSNGRTILIDLASTTSASFNGTSNITPGVSNTLPTTHGGTGKTAWDSYKIIYASGQNTLAQLDIGSEGEVLLSQGTGKAAKWENQQNLNVGTAAQFTMAKSITLTGDVTGTASSQAGWSITTTIGAGKVTNAMLAGSIANSKLVNSKITIAGNDISLGGSLAASTLVASLGLSKAMRFIGVATVTITDGSTTDPAISGYSTKTAGDVIIDKDSSREYVWSTTGNWELLGGDSSYKTTQSTVDSGAAATNKWVARIQQNANGVITVTMGTLDTSGTWSGNAATATTLTCPSLTTEANIESGTRSYQGSGDSWTGSITSMAYAGILQVCGGYSRGWQIWATRGDNATQSLHWRNPNNAATAWNEERIILDSGNYTNYTVTKTGTGASGTWSISVTGSSGSCTGNAATATKLQTARTIWGQSFNGSVNISGNMSDVGPNIKLPSGQTGFSFLTSGGGAATGKFGGVGISSSYSDTDVSTYGLDIYAKPARFRVTNATINTSALGKAIHAIHIQTGNGSGSGVNDGYATALTFGDSSAYAGIYYQSSGSYGSRLIFATTDSYAAGSKARAIITNIGRVGIGTLSPDYTLDVTGDIRARNAWLRTTGDAGWYSDTYGGGWYMTDNTWIRAYNNKPVYVSNTSDNAIYTSGGVCALAANGLRVVYGSRAFIIRNDSNNTYFMPGSNANVTGNNWAGYYSYVENGNGYWHFVRAYGAVWNDYAEYRVADTIEPGRVVQDTIDGRMILVNERLSPACKVISDTYGFAIGETEQAKTPIAVSGRVLVYPYQVKEKYKIGMAVCSAPNGSVDIMSREEIMTYPERIIGTVSEIPNYDVWEQKRPDVSGNNDPYIHRIPVNGRIWIYVR